MNGNRHFEFEYKFCLMYVLSTVANAFHFPFSFMCWLACVSHKNQHHTHTRNAITESICSSHSLSFTDAHFFASMTFYVCIVQNIARYIRSTDAYCMGIFLSFSQNLIEKKGVIYCLNWEYLFMIDVCCCCCCFFHLELQCILCVAMNISHISPLSIKWTVLMNCLTSHILHAITVKHTLTSILTITPSATKTTTTTATNPLLACMHSVIDRFKANITALPRVWA